MKNKSKILILLIVLGIGIFTTIKTTTYEIINTASLEFEDIVDFNVTDSYDKTKGKYGQITYTYKFTKKNNYEYPILYFNDSLLRSSLFPKSEIPNEFENSLKINPTLTKTNTYNLTEKDLENGFVTNNIEYCLNIENLEQMPYSSNTLIDDMKDEWMKNQCEHDVSISIYKGTYEDCLKDENVQKDIENYLNQDYACGQKSITTKVEKPVVDKKDNVEVVNVPSTALNSDTIMLWVALLVTAICSFALYITVKSKKRKIK